MYCSEHIQLVKLGSFVKKTTMQVYFNEICYIKRCLR